MRAVFFGSSLFSIPALEAVLEHSGIELIFVMTTPPRKKGRGMHLLPSEVAAFCAEKEVPFHEYKSLRTEEALDLFKDANPYLFIVSSYGKIIPESLLEIPQYRLNVHPSLIPLYRGAGPIQWPIINGDQETGVSIIDIAAELDVGDIYHQITVPITQNVTGDELTLELANLSKEALKETLNQVLDGKLKGVEQDHEKSTYARKLNKEDGLISWNDSAKSIQCKIRGLQPWPLAYTYFNDQRLVLLKSQISETSTKDAPGTIINIDKSGIVEIATGNGNLGLLTVKPEGKKEMSAADFCRGRQLKAGMSLA